MLDIVKESYNSIYESFNNSVLMWKNGNKAVYIFIQQFQELLIKQIIYDANKSSYLGHKPNLGSLLSNKFVKDFLKYELDLSDQDFKTISDINFNGNKTKHTDDKINYLEDDIVNYIRFNFSFFKKYLLKFKKLDIGDFDESVLTRAEEKQFKLEIQQVKNDKVDDLIQYQNKQIEVLEKESKKLENLNLDIVSDIQLEKIRRYDFLKSNFAKYTEKIELIKKQLDDSPDDVYLLDEIDNLTLDLQDIEDELRTFKQSEFKTNDITLQRNTALLEENRLKIESFQKIKQEIEVIKDSDDIYTDFSLLVENCQVSYDSCFLGDLSFSIFNVSDEDKCISKYEAFYATVFNQLIRGRYIQPSQYLITLNLNETEYRIVYQLEILVLSLIRNNRLDDNQWDLNIINSSLTYLNIAIGDLTNRVKTLTALANVRYEIPLLNLTSTDLSSDKNNISFEVIYPNKSNSYTILSDFSDDTLANLWIADRIKYKINDSSEHTDILNILLLELFGFAEFRSGQIEILRSTLNGNNTIGILTTSGGKSLIYQMAALMQPKFTIIVDPINALIIDQYRKLTEEFKIDRVVKLIAQTTDDGTLSAKTIVEKMFRRPSIFIFSSPERFQNKVFRDWLIAQSIKKKIGLIVLDEVHCLSEWGHDFRVSYLMLSHTINTYCSNVQYLGLTATAAINVIKDLQVELGIYDKDNIVFSKKLQRDNLNFSILKTKSYDHLLETFDKVLKTDYDNPRISFSLEKSPANAYIVFFKTKALLNKMHEKYLNSFPNEITLFSGDVKSTQDDFIRNKKTLLFATKAFGMGIDKPNVRRTIHFGIPPSRESFFQEAGRAGRDGKKSGCLLLTYESNPRYQEKINRFLDLSTSVEELKEINNHLGYSDDSDLSTIAFFMTQDLNTPEKESEQTLEVLRKLVKGLNNLNVIHLIDSKYLNNFQNKLYILHKIGIIRTWTLEFRGNDTRVLDIQFHPEYLDIDHIKQTSINYLNQYLPNTELINKIDRIESIDQLYDIIVIIREWYQSTFLRSKREQLANMFDFVERYKNSQVNDAIQNEMSQFFDISRLLEKRESKLSFTFDGVNIRGVLKRASIIKNNQLQEIRVVMERLLETEESNKINLFMSLIMLRLDNFKTRNGQDRLKLALSKSTEAEVDDFFSSIPIIYKSCSNTAKKDIIDFTFNYNSQYFMKHLSYEENIDEFIAPYLIQSINKHYSDIL